MNESVNYWLRKLFALNETDINETWLPAVGPMATVRVELDLETSKTITESAFDQDVNIYKLYLSAICIVWNRYYSPAAFIINTPFFTNNEAVGESNNSLLFYKISRMPGATGRSLLKHIHTEMISGLQNEQYNLNELFERLASNGMNKEGALLNMGFCYRNLMTENDHFRKNNIQCVLEKKEERFCLEIRSRGFLPETFSRNFGSHIVTALKTLIQDLDQETAAINIIPEEQENELHTFLKAIAPIATPHKIVEKEEIGTTGAYTELQARLIKIWQEVLNRPVMHIRSSFFENGGHSLLVVKLISRIYREFSIHLELSAVFQHPTIEKMEGLIRNAKSKKTLEIKPLDPMPAYDVSHGQLRLWYIHQFEEIKNRYNCAYTYRIKGDITVSNLQKALLLAGERHESLRTVFIEEEGLPKQQVLPFQPSLFTLDQIDAQLFSEAAIAVEINSRSSFIFDLANGPLIKVALFRLNAEEYILQIVLHHIITDGWSMEILMREIWEAYAALEKGKMPASLPQPIQYKEFASWQNERLAGLQQESINLWLSQFYEPPAPVELPIMKKGPLAGKPESRVAVVDIDADTARSLRTMAQQNNATLFSTVFTAINLLLYRYTGKTDLLLGLPVAGRDEPELEQVVGFFVNVLPVRTRFNAADSFLAVLKQVQATMVNGYKWQFYPVDKIVEALKLKGYLENSSLYNIEVNHVANAARTVNDDTGLQVSFFHHGYNSGKNDLQFNICESGEQLSVSLEYNAQLFEPRSIELLIAHFPALLQSIVQTPDEAVVNLYMPVDGIQVAEQITERVKVSDNRNEQEAMQERHEQQAPVNETITLLKSIWSGVLGKANIDNKDNFWRIGGYSLNALRMAAKIYKVFGVKLDVSVLIKHPVLEDLARVIEASAKKQYTGIEKIAIAGHYPASHAQKRVWMLSQLEESSVSQHVHEVFALKTGIQIPVLKMAITQLLARHEMLRTVFHFNNDEIVQEVLNEDLTAAVFRQVVLDESANDNTIEDEIARERKMPFDLEKGPLVRITLFQSNTHGNIICFVLHHIITDQGSMDILFRDLSAAYRSCLTGEAATEQELAIQYKDYTVWHNRQLEMVVRKQHIAFWKKRLEGTLPFTGLPFDFTRPAVKSYRGDHLLFEMDAQRTALIRETARNHEVTVFVFLLSSFFACLHKLTGQSDLLIGLPVSGRVHDDLENQIGLYLNGLPCRISIGPGESFSTLLSKVKEGVVAITSRQLYPFDMLLSDLNIQRSANRAPLFETVFNYTNATGSGSRKARETLFEPFVSSGRTTTAKHDMMLGGKEFSNKIVFHVEYTTDLYKKTTIAAFIKEFNELIDVFVSPQGAGTMLARLTDDDPAAGLLLTQRF